MRTLVLVSALAACGDNAAPRVNVSSEGAAWAAVRIGDAWTRFDDVPFSFELPIGERYEIVTVCRTDVGLGWTLIGRVQEPDVIDRPCWYPEPRPPATTFPVGLDVTGELDWASMAGTWLSTRGAETPLPSGRWDLVALRDPIRGGMVPRPSRVVLQRDVVVDRPLRIPIDVEADGADLVPAGITIDGDVAFGAQATTITEGQAWFSTAFPAEVLPHALARPGDHVHIDVYDNRRWAEFEYYGPVDLSLPTERVGADLRWAPLPVADLEMEGAWAWVRLHVSDDFVRSWDVWIQPDVAEEEGRIAFTAPPFRDWNPDWLPDPAADHWWTVRWSRARADGGTEGLSVGAIIHAE